MFYVSVIDGKDYRLLLGPFKEHQAALDQVNAVREKANDIDPKSWFYAFGTAKAEGAGPGILNDLFPELAEEMA